MIPWTELELTMEDHRKAFTELSFLLEILIGTIGDLIGGATATVGRTAGRHMAAKLPIYLVDPTIEQVLEALADHWHEGFDFSFTCDDGSADLSYGRCAIREVCANRSLKPGQDLCKMFHFFMAGMVEQLLGVPIKGRIISAGETCRSHLEER